MEQPPEPLRSAILTGAGRPSRAAESAQELAQHGRTAFGDAR